MLSDQSYSQIGPALKNLNMSLLIGKTCLKCSSSIMTKKEWESLVYFQVTRRVLVLNHIQLSMTSSNNKSTSHIRKHRSIRINSSSNRWCQDNNFTDNLR